MKKKGLYILDRQPFDDIYGPEQRAALADMVDFVAPPQTAETVRANPGVLKEAQVILSGWVPPVMDAAFLAAAPQLEAVFYGAGSVRKFVTDALWERGIVVTSAAALNAVPVAEFTLSQILFSLKRGWAHAMNVRERGKAGRQRQHVPGAFHSTVGIISLGEIGAAVCRLLRHFDVRVLGFDPFVGEAAFEELGVERAELDEIFSRCDAVSLHSPNLPSTRGMIAGRHFRRMKPDATFINTARGDIVREVEMVDAMIARPDLWAILDVLANDDRCADERIYQLPNVIHTPHIAGACDGECRRMGQAMVDELRRYLDGEPLRWRVQPDRYALMA